MKITLKRTNDAVRFEGANPAGNTVTIEGSPDIGGEGLGMRPMELVLVSLASCTSMDLVTILKKKRQVLEDLTIEVSAERAKDQVPAVFTKIHMHFIFKGDLQEKAVEQSLRLAKDYCSVGKMLEKSVELTYDFVIINA